MVPIDICRCSEQNQWFQYKSADALNESNGLNTNLQAPLTQSAVPVETCRCPTQNHYIVCCLAGLVDRLEEKEANKKQTKQLTLNIRNVVFASRTKFMFYANPD
jgi:hypothetical protein